MRKERKHYTAEEEVAILRRHLLDKVAVPICVKSWARLCSSAQPNCVGEFHLASLPVLSLAGVQIPQWAALVVAELKRVRRLHELLGKITSNAPA